MSRTSHVGLPRAAFVVISVVVLLSGCSVVSITPEYESVIGMTMLDAVPLLPGDLVIYDLSTPILDIPSAYDGGEPAGHWVVVAQCPGIDAGAIGVLPIDEYVGDIVTKAEASSWNDALLECSR